MLRQQFTRQSRLLKPAEFKRVFQRPYRSGDNYFRILARTNDICSHRLGMAVAKKAIPKAVRRNQIKRLVRESFRTQMTGRLNEKALDIVVLPTAHAASQDNTALFESLNALWQKLNKNVVARQINPGKPTKDTR